MKTLSSAGDLAHIRNRIALLSPTDARLWGSMSAHQAVCHLTDAFCGPLAERVAPPIKVSRIPIPIYKWLALDFPMKWPHGAPTPPEMNQQIGGTTPADFAADHATLNAKLDQFARCSGPWSPHPFFGEMTTREWMRWGYLHTDHHLRQFGR
jgi:hypothetical protein